VTGGLWCALERLAARIIDRDRESGVKDRGTSAAEPHYFVGPHMKSGEA
jgi:hypothetical protein